MVKGALAAMLLLACACRRDMADRPEQRPLGRSAFFADRSASRPAVADTVPRALASAPASVARGRERYIIYCEPCHGARGDGDGVIVRHGFPRPPSLLTSTADVARTIAEGKGKMYSYADRVPEADRFAIAAYIKQLQAERR